MNRMTQRSLRACRNARSQRYGQAVVNNFKLKDNSSFSSYADRLYYASDEEASQIIEQMIIDFQIPAH